MRVVKKIDGEVIAEFYHGLSPQCIPPNLVIEKRHLSYDFIEGITPFEWKVVWDWSEEYIWHLSPHVPLGDGFDVERYASYMLSVLCYTEIKIDIDKLLKIIEEADYTPVWKCHGDLTLKNCVQTVTGEIIYLDPGNARGLPCREQDESKILQSLDGFDCVYRGHMLPAGWPRMEVRKIHWALLVCHYLRLLRHVTHEPSLQFARHRIKTISEWIL